jgi:hypothetical protein
LATAKPGVIFSFPIDGQVDVPVGSRIVVAFSDPVEKSAIGSCTATSGAFCVIGPNGPVDATPVVSDDGKVVSIQSELEPGASYQVFVRSELAPNAENLKEGPLFSFTTRTDRPRAAAPTLVAVNGGDPAMVGMAKPVFETTTLRLLFSEPLDPRGIKLGAGSVELLDSSGSAVEATIVSDGIHIAVDPKEDLTAGAQYVLRLGNGLVDLGGQAITPISLDFTPTQSRNGPPVLHALKTTQEGDPGPTTSLSGAPVNVIAVDKPLIGHNESKFLPTTLIGEISDPKALGGPIAFTIRKGQRLTATGMEIKLGGQIPSGLETGEVQIELLTDATGMLYRNPYQDPGQRPENARSPVYVDLSMDVAMFAKDKNGNAALTQTVLGMQATGTAIATDGVLAIETVSSMELGLLGVTKAPSNIVLSLWTNGPGDPPPADMEAPVLASSSPGQSEEGAVDGGIELIFNEPIDLDRARAGGIKLEDTVSGAVATLIESHGSAVVVRPLQPLAYSRVYRVVMSDVADVAGNKATIPNLSFTTSVLQTSGVPGTIAAIKPGAPCVLTGGTATSPGRCAGGDGADELYHPFTLGANAPIDVGFTVPVRRSSVTRGAACNQGSVRVEEVDASGNCTAVVAGTLMTHDRSIQFVPDVPWVVGKQYKLTLVSGGNGTCDAGELCGPGGAMSFDPLNGTESGDGGGGNLSIVFTGEQDSGGTYMYATAAPSSDVNGSGFMDSSEQPHDENRAGMRILGATGSINSASFDDPDCDPSTPEKENCMYLLGAMPTIMEPVTTECNGLASQCQPLTLSPQAMYATSLSMTAQTILAPIGTKTGTNVMRVREPADGPVKGYIIDDGAGKPKMVTTLDLYMDAPDMSVLLSSHDLHSKKMTLKLEGPVTFLPDGRIAISLANIEDVPVTVAISGPLSGTVKMVLPKGAMHLQLSSPALRGVSL